MDNQKPKCAKCLKEMDEDKYKTCDKSREYMKQNHQKNKEARNQRRMEYYRNHLEEAKACAKKYKEEHRAEINERTRKHRAENIEKITAKIKWTKCPTYNWEVQSKHVKRHTQTLVHQENLKKSDLKISFYNIINYEMKC